MKQQLNVYKSSRLWVFVLAIMIIPNIVKAIIIKLFNFHFENPIWYSVIDMTIVLFISIPMFAYLMKRSNTYAHKLMYQQAENSKINEKLLSKHDELKYLSTYDYLTGLPNRHQLFEMVDAIVKNDTEQSTMIIFVDIDQFKVVNDSMGHAFGDQHIKQVANKLRDNVPKENFIARFGSDKFVIVHEVKDESTYTIIADHILNIFSEPLYIKNTKLYTTVSLGITVYPRDGKSANQLIKNADQSVYIAKEYGGNTYHIFTPGLDNNAKREMTLINGLRTVIKDEQLKLYYQPLVNLKTGQITCVEALLRWEHPKYGLITPDEFISLAEKTGDIISIGEWVLNTACQQIKEWRKIGYSELQVAVNVSIRQIKEINFPELVRNTLKETKLAPHALKIEITESMIQNIKESSAVFKQLKDLGVKIVIDDFGTGYSSLNLLGFLNIDYLKIDRSFTNGLLTHDNMNSIVKTIINMGHNLQVQLVGEGIENTEQESVLKQSGCDLGQGYLYSKPLPKVELEQYLRKKNRVHSV